MTQTAVFRADAAPGIGGGHVMRCLALAEALSFAGWRTLLATRPATQATVPAAAALEHIAVTMEAVIDEPAALAEVLPGGCDLLVIDHYGWSIAEERASRRFARRIAVLDDFAAAAHDADVVIDPTPGRRATDYAPHVSPSTTVLAGAAWAPLRPAIRRAREASLAARRARRPGRLIVAMGMTDPGNATGRVLECLADLPSGWTVDVVLGSAAPHREAVRAALPPAATLHLDPPDLPALLAAADLAIGAGGVSALERACLGLPSFLVEIADNQHAAIAGLAASGAAVPLGPVENLSASLLQRTLADVLGSTDTLARMAEAAALICDGLGAARVGTVLSPALARDGSPVSLRPAGLEDASIILSWQQAPGVRAFSRNPRIPAMAEHVAWLTQKLLDPACIFSLIMNGTKPVGVIRLDGGNDGGGRFEISILVDPAQQGRGIGRAALSLTRRLVPWATLDATVLPANTASATMFTAAGFAKAEGGFVSLSDRSSA